MIQENLERKTKLKSFIVNKLCEKGLDRARAELEKVENFLVENCATKNAHIIKDHLQSMENLEGNFCQLDLWN